MNQRQKARHHQTRLQIRKAYQKGIRRGVRIVQKKNREWIPCHVSGYHHWFRNIKDGDKVLFYTHQSNTWQDLEAGQDFHKMGVDGDFCTNQCEIRFHVETGRYVLYYT